MVRNIDRKVVGVVLLSLVLVLGLLLPALVAPQTTKAEEPELYALVQIPSGGEATLKASVMQVLDSGGVYAIVGCTQAQLDSLKTAGYTVIGDPCAVSAECLANLTATLKSLIGSVGVFQLQGGPDAFGYKFIDSNQQGGPCFNWIDITQTGTLLHFNCDDCGQGYPLGFNFTFYGSTGAGVGISSNGFLGFSGSMDDFSNDCIPNAGTPNNAMFVFWDDLICNCPGADLFYQTFGDAPNRYCVIEWANNKFFNDCNSPSLTFEAILYEGSNSILFQYLNMTGSTRAQGDSATVGIENAAGTGGLQYSCDSPAISNSLAILFYLPPVDPGSFNCLGAAVTVPAQPAHPKVSPSMPNYIKPAQMSLQYLNVNPQQASANQSVTITTNVVNTGDEAGSYNVALKINGQLETSRTVSVGPQGTQPVKFTLTRTQPGTYAIDIGGQKGTFTVLAAKTTSGPPISSSTIIILIMFVLIISTVVVLMFTFRRPA
jgi:hypothetical protein